MGRECLAEGDTGDPSTAGEVCDHEKPGEQARDEMRPGERALTPLPSLLPFGLESSPTLVGVRGDKGDAFTGTTRRGCTEVDSDGERLCCCTTG